MERLLAEKLPLGKQVEYGDTSVMASVNDRSAFDLTKRFEDMHIDWSVVKRQLFRGTELFHSGKKLRSDPPASSIDPATITLASVSCELARVSSTTQ